MKSRINDTTDDVDNRHGEMMMIIMMEMISCLIPPLIHENDFLPKEEERIRILEL